MEKVLKEMASAFDLELMNRLGSGEISTADLHIIRQRLKDCNMTVSESAGHGPLHLARDAINAAAERTESDPLLPPLDEPDDIIRHAG